MKKLSLTCFLAVCAALATPALRADTIGFTTTGGSLTGNPNGNSNGYTFTLANTVSVTQLGFYDSGADGLSAAIPVTIYSTAASHAVLANATVPAGTGTELNGYIYVTLATPVTLPAGTYLIAAYSAGNTDYLLYNVTTVTGATGITYGGAMRGAGTGYPATPVTGVNAYFGPNFQIFSAVVPEPSTWALLIVGVVGLGFVTLRRRRAVRLA